MRVLIYGAGVIGSLYAALFSEAGVDTSVYARGERLETLRRSGLRYEKNGAVCTANVCVLDALHPNDIYDFIFLTVRENQLHEALAQLREEQPDWPVMGLWPDLTDYAAVERAVQEVAQTFGGVDILVNNAGISAREPLADYSPEAFRSIMDLNVTAVFHGCKAVEPIMRAAGKGCIINTSSMVSLYGQPSGVGYPTSKFAVNGLTRSLARELGRAGIRVNAVAPGVTRTDMVAALPKELIDRISAPIPLGRIGEPQEVANAYLFLASDLASYVTGEILSVDGAAQT